MHCLFIIGVLLLSISAVQAQATYRHVGADEPHAARGSAHKTIFTFTAHQFPSKSCSGTQHVYARSGLSSNQGATSVCPHCYLEGGVYWLKPKRKGNGAWYPLMGSHAVPRGQAYFHQGAIPIGTPVTITTEKIENQEYGFVTWKWGTKTLKVKVALPGWKTHVGRANVLHEVYSSSQCWPSVHANFDNIQFVGGAPKLYWREFAEYKIIKSPGFSGFAVRRGGGSVTPAPAPNPPPPTPPCPTGQKLKKGVCK